MTTSTDTAPTDTHATTGQEKGADLLQVLLKQLAANGYRKIAVDTWRRDTDLHNIQHGYGCQEWTITAWHDGQANYRVSWDATYQLPQVRRLLDAILPPPF